LNAGHNLNEVPDMAYSKFGLNINYDELNRFIGSLTYSIRSFIFSAMAQKPKRPWHNAPYPKYATGPRVIYPSCN